MKDFRFLGIFPIENAFRSFSLPYLAVILRYQKHYAQPTLAVNPYQSYSPHLSSSSFGNKKTRHDFDHKTQTSIQYR